MSPLKALLKISYRGYCQKMGKETPISDFELMVIQADTLFIHDAKGQLKFINEPITPEKHPVPRLFIGRTTIGSVYRFFKNKCALLRLSGLVN